MVDPIRDFDRFVGEWRPRLLALAYNEGFKGPDQEDAVQDILSDLFRQELLEKFDPVLGTFETYIYGHARVRLKGYRQRFWKRGQHEFQFADHGGWDAPNASHSSSANLESRITQLPDGALLEAGRRLEIEDLNELLTKTYQCLAAEPSTPTKNLSRLFAEMVEQVRTDGQVDFQKIAASHGWSRQAISQQARDLRNTTVMQRLRSAIE